MTKYKTVTGNIFPEFSGWTCKFDKCLNEAVAEGWELVKFETVPHPQYYDGTKAVALMQKEVDD